MSTAALSLFVNQASAKSWTDIIMDKQGILTKPSIIQNMVTQTEQWQKIGNAIWNGIQWLYNLPENIPLYSLQLCSSIFHLLFDVVLETPILLFDNPVIQDKMLVFSGVSILLVTVFTAISGIKQMLLKRHTPLKTIMTRFFAAVTISGFAPAIFKGVFSFLNFISKQLCSLTDKTINVHSIINNNSDAFGLVALTGFDLVSIALLIPILLKTAKRWFDLLCLSAVTPLAMAASVFDETRHFFHSWLDGIINRGQTQLVYAFFLFIMSVFIFGTVGITSTYGILVRFLILIGGLMELANPPGFVTKLASNDQSLSEYWNSMKNTKEKVISNLTFNKFAKIKKLIAKHKI